MQDTNAAAVGLPATDGDLYQRLMGQEERVLRTVNRLATEREAQRQRERDPLRRSVADVWRDINMNLLGILLSPSRESLQRLYRDPDTQMHLGLALVVAGAIALLVSSIAQ
jgi:hypothetical protein